MIKSLICEGRFLAALWKTNLSSAMEYRASFISQAFGMVINDAIFFIFWLLFFERFKVVKGWHMQDMLLLFSIVTTGYGAGMVLFGNATALSELISTGRLDYYLALPRNVLLHVLASRSMVSAWGDAVFGIAIFAISGPHTAVQILLWVAASACSATIMICFFAMAGSLAFWLGSSQGIANQAHMALITISTYPDTLFQGGIRVMLLTVIPALLVGAIPFEMVKRADSHLLPLMLAAAGFFIMLLLLLFYSGLKRYESGSMLNVNI